VRGLDYYNLTVFEWITDALGAQGTVCGGGRYDPLPERMGGRPSASCGFAMGVERVIELLAQTDWGARAAPDVYLVHQSGPTASRAFLLGEQLRDAGLDVVYHAGDASMKSQMKKADASGAQYAVIVGAEEVAAGAAAVKALRATSPSAAFAAQRNVPVGELAETLVDALTDEQE
jgi:histidyl-tRNA synthetase